MKYNTALRNYIEEHGFIKVAIAKKCGIQEKKFYRILSGHQEMTVDEFELICRSGLGIEPAIFFKTKLSIIEKSA